MTGRRPHLLILGGTGEAYELAEILAGRDDLLVTSSLAGATTSPRRPAGSHRIGGFGGAAGLAAWLATEAISLVLDASHPFASRITAQAREAANAAGIGYLRLERPAWRPGPGDDWRLVPDLDAGLAALTPGARRVFAAAGARALDRLGLAPMDFVVRGVDPPVSVPANVTFVRGRGPFVPEAERQLLQAQDIDALLCRNSGGQAARAKLEAARELRLPVVMIERPDASLPDAVPDVPSALAALGQRFFGLSTWV